MHDKSSYEDATTTPADGLNVSTQVPLLSTPRASMQRRFRLAYQPGGGHRITCAEYWADPHWHRFGWEPAASGCSCRPGLAHDQDAPVRELLRDLARLLPEQPARELADVLPQRLVADFRRHSALQDEWNVLALFDRIDCSSAAAAA